ncbi:hypothetical protein N7516_007419 [Penicillium verrucosum]|uniref:uncharacterized protein n=1 Tax=Penicillium verrucosum TaxID=60171 RepID=UPI0025456A1D|nr:uncharacterized protein N7516_007419 [Penicillium verrucosum]KAJ5932930.1 hypothetical protein N7516_007419 [Penicillium verrucosum]
MSFLDMEFAFFIALGITINIGYFLWVSRDFNKSPPPAPLSLAMTLGKTLLPGLILAAVGYYLHFLYSTPPSPHYGGQSTSAGML